MARGAAGVALAARCTIVGSRRGETLRGTSRRDVICGLGGNDRLIGRGGGDVVRGGSGTDTLGGGDGTDFLDGGTGRDTLGGGSGTDRLVGGTGGDRMAGGAGSDLADYLGRTAAVFVSIGNGANDGAAGEGDNVLGDVERLRGGSGSDTLRGDADANSLDGQGGGDNLRGGAGSDTFQGRAGADTLDSRDGGAFVDRLFCGAAVDTALADPPDIRAADCENVVVNRFPTDISLSNASVAENQPAATVVGTLSTTDPDAGDTHTYSLVSSGGCAGPANASFQIDGSTLAIAAPLDFEAGATRSVCIRTNDGHGGTFDKQFTITVTDANEAPSNIALTNASVAENQPANSTVGTLSATDQDAGQTHSFSLQTSGCSGSFPDSSAFTVVGSQLRTAASFNFEAKSSYTICLRVTDNGSPAASLDEQFTISVTNVNEAPTDIALSGASVAENQPSGTTVGTLSASDQDDGDTAAFSLVAGIGSADNASFTITGTSLRTNAVFDFETKSSYSIRIRATDGGSLTFEEAFTISVTNVNEAPVNTVPGAQAVNEDTDLTFAGGNGNALSVADVDAGAGSIRTTVSASNGIITPASGSGATVTGSGTASAQITGTLAQVNAALNGLRYRGTANWNSTRGTETLTIVTDDQGNSGSGGAKSDTDTVGITVTAVNDAPTAAAKNYTAQANMKVSHTGLLTGASDPDAGDGGYTPSFTVGTVGATSPAGGTVTVTNAATGAFDLDPPPGVTGNVTFTYTVCDSGNPGPSACSAAATVTVNVAGPVIWFVSAATGNDTTGKGTLAAPFQTIAKVDTVDAASHGIFLYAGTYTNGITLNAGERLVGQGTTGTSFDSLFGITPPAGTLARPTLPSGTATVQGTVTLASNALLRGLALSTGASTGLTGSGGLTGIGVAQVSVSTTTGTAVNLNNAVGTYAFGNISTNGAANGILLDTLGASTFSATGGSIVSASTRGVDINGGTGNFSYGGTISTSGAGRSVEVTSHTGGTVAFSGAIGDSGSGISLVGNTGATIDLTGGMTLSTGASTALNATGGGTVNVTGAANTLATTTGTALNVADTTIGAGGLTFRSIAANGAVNGIVLNNTGSSGGLTVTGNSAGLCGGSVGAGPPASPATATAPNAADCTGGVIQNTTGAGIVLSSTRGVSLTRMRVANGGNDGIQGTSVTNFTLASSLIEDNGNAQGEAELDFGDVNDTTPDGLFGTASITNSTIRDSSERNVSVRNQSGSLAMTVTGSQFTNVSANAGSDDGVLFDMVGTASVTVNAQNNYFAANRGDHFQAAGSNSATLNVTFKNNTLTGGHATALGQGITINAATGVAFGGYTGRIDYDVDGNNIQGAILSAVNVILGTSGNAGTFDGFLRNNVIGTSGAARSCSAQAHGMSVEARGNGTHTSSVTGNTIKRCFDRGIGVTAGDGNGVFNLTVTGNTINELTDTDAANGTPREALEANLGLTSTNVFGQIDSPAVCLHVTSTSGNMVGGAFKNGDIRVRQRFRASVRLPGYAGTAFDTAAVVSFLQANNPGATATAASNNDAAVTTDGYFGGAACTLPS